MDPNSELRTESPDGKKIGIELNNTESPKMKLDTVLLQLGEFGRYQKRVYFLLCLPAVLCAMHKLAWVFLGAKMDYRCKLPIELDNATYFELPKGIDHSKVYPWDSNLKNWSQCKRLDVNFNDDYYFSSNEIEIEQVGCDDQYVFDTTKYESSAVIDFQLVCNREIMRSHAQALFMVGILIGSFVFGDLSDRFGRRPIFFLSLVLQVTFGILAGLAPEYYTFVITRMVVGASTSGIFLVGFVIAMELVGPKYRVVTGVVCQLFFTTGYLVTAIFAYTIRDWKILQIALSLPGLIFLSYYWILPESIRWLLARGRKGDAVKILRKVAKENNVELHEEVYDGLCEETSKTGAANIFQVFRYRRLGFRAINIFFSWFVNSGVYYGLSLNTSNLGGNDYFNFFISGAVEVPAYTFLLLSLNRLGRKIVLCGCMLAGGIAMSACALVPDGMTWLLISFSMIGKCCITASYGVIYILTAENFPTVVRNAGVGTSSMFARVGGILSYYVLELSSVWKPLPLLIFGGLSISGGLLALLIPETLGKRLPETLEEGNNFGTNDYDNNHRDSTATSASTKEFNGNEKTNM